MVVMCLSWWGKAIISSQDCKDFQAAVEEVAWVLEKVSISISFTLSGLKCAADNLDITSSKKRVCQ